MNTLKAAATTSLRSAKDHPALKTTLDMVIIV